tara:strand:+ start:112 stop:1419 length:1308 start_codon:yes stop_codon:yes gene_type:complete
MLEIEEAKEILKKELGFGPERSSLIYCDLDSVGGFFQPRLLRANVGMVPESTLLTREIHEYLGHGSYCEHARNGRRIVRYEQELSYLEKHLIGRKLDEDVRVGIRIGNKRELIESDPNNCVLYVDRDNFWLQQYLRVQEEYRCFFRENLLSYEGFAVWLEEFLLKRLDREDIWLLRQEEIRNTEYELFFREFKKEEESGLLSLIYKVGFPKQFDKESVLRVVNEHLNLDDLSLLILYGSKREYGDIDLLVVGKGERVYTEDLDILCVSEEEFVRRLKLRDIELTEPLFTGKVVFGSRERVEGLKKEILEGEFSEEAFNHLERKALEAYSYAVEYLDVGTFEAIENLLNSGRSLESITDDELGSRYFLYSLHNLSYVWSYYLSRKMYNGGCTLVTLDMFENDVLGDILDCIKDVKNGLNCSRDKVKEFVDKTKLFF